MTLPIRNSQFAIRNCLPLIRNSQFAIRNCSQGFSLVELLVVIGIIAVLAGVLFATFGGSSESAKTARCLSNMKTLAMACQAYGAEHGRYPHAGSIEYMRIDESEGISNVKAVYNEVPGWISWASMGAYRNKATSHKASASWMTSLYSENLEENHYCLTNGALWKYVSGNHDTFVCPSHKAKKSKTPPQWSYLMNAYFGWDTSRGGDTEAENFPCIEYGHLGRADRVLLFAEIPFDGKVGAWQPEGGGAGMDGDCVLQFDAGVNAKIGSRGLHQSGLGNENIGFNHKNGKMTFANVAFADGHCEKLRLPKGGISDSQLRELTAWLCMGVDVSFDGRQYQKMDN